MSVPEWSEEFATGIETLDAQHRLLFETLDNLEQSIRGGRSHPMLRQTLLEVDNYIKEHFIAEEELFLKYEFPKTKEHVAAHRQFAEEILAFYPRIEQDRLDALVMSEYLRIWILTHVMKMDMECKAFFRSIGVI